MLKSKRVHDTFLLLCVCLQSSAMISGNAIWFQSAGQYYKGSLCSLCQPAWERPATTWVQLTLNDNRHAQPTHSPCAPHHQPSAAAEVFWKFVMVTFPLCLWGLCDPVSKLNEGSPPLLFLYDSLIPFSDFMSGWSLTLCGGAVVNTGQPKNVLLFWACFGMGIKHPGWVRGRARELWIYKCPTKTKTQNQHKYEWFQEKICSTCPHLFLKNRHDLGSHIQVHYTNNIYRGLGSIGIHGSRRIPKKRIVFR